MVKVFFVLMYLLVFALSVGCSSNNYEFGNVSKAYCQSDNKETRSLIKAVLNSKGVNVGVDYCALRGFVGGVIHNG